MKNGAIAIDGFAKLCKSNVPAGFPGRQ